MEVGMRTYVTRLCVNCGRDFLAKPDQVRRGRGLNCSRACANARHGAWPDRFWRKVNKTASCWLWTAGTNGDGYGVAYLPGHIPQSAHRVAWLLLNGPIPDGVFVLHNCPGGDNPLCVNPDHLWLGSQDLNVADMMAKGRGNKAQGERTGKAKLTDAIVRLIRERYAAHVAGRTQLAREYGVSKGAIDRVIERRSWRHVA
jgi:hypothetical protein